MQEEAIVNNDMWLCDCSDRFYSYSNERGIQKNWIAFYEIIFIGNSV